jgi:RNA polymerase sigma-70 factor (ECF subfamily)
MVIVTKNSHILKTQEEIIKRCLKGDETAFSALYHQFSSKMMVVCTRYSSDYESAQDLLQEDLFGCFNIYINSKMKALWKVGFGELL